MVNFLAKRCYIYIWCCLSIRSGVIHCLCFDITWRTSVFRLWPWNARFLLQLSIIHF